MTIVQRPSAAELPPIVVSMEHSDMVKAISVRMAEIAYFSGSYLPGDSERLMIAGNLHVAPNYRRRGIGEQMVRRLGLEAYRRNLEAIHLIITSQYALDIHGKVYGKDNLTIDPIPRGDYFPLETLQGEVTFDEARAWLAEAEQYEPQEEGKLFRDHGFFVIASPSDAIER